MEEREEGEVSDGNEDSFGLSYKPMVRPDASLYRRVERHVPSSDEDYSSDSDSDSPLAAKRKRPNVSKMDTGGSESHDPRAWTLDNGTQESRPIAKARRRNNIWSSVMEEQVLAQEIGGFGLKRRLDQGDRSVESYDYLQARQFREQEAQQYSDEDEEEEEDEETKNKRMSRKRHVKERLSYRKPKTKSGKRELIDVEIRESMTDDEVGLAIAEGLMERKPELIVRVVEVLGREKALDLYKNTQELERDGGLMVLNGSRRRTSGGVYLHLLKTYPTLEHTDLIKIFSQDEAGSLQQWRKRKRAHRKRERHESKPQDPTGETASEEGLHLGELFSDDPGGAKCPGSTPVTSPQPSDTEEQELAGPLINKLSPQEIMPPSSPQPPSATTDPRKTPDQPLETYNGGFLNIEVENSKPKEEISEKNRSAEVAYDDDFLDIHGNDEMELF